MTKTTLKIGTAGRAQIPSDIREKLNISPGDRLIVDITEVLRDQGIERESTSEQRLVA